MTHEDRVVAPLVQPTPGPIGDRYLRQHHAVFERERRKYFNARHSGARWARRGGLARGAVAHEAAASPRSMSSMLKYDKETGDWVDVLDPDREPNHFGLDARRCLLLLAQLGMRGRGRVYGQALGVAHVRQMAEHLQRLDKLHARLRAALDAEHDHGAALAVQVFLVQGIRRVTWEPGVPDPLHVGVTLQVARHLLRVLAVALHAKR